MDYDRLFKMERLLAREFGEHVVINPLSLWTADDERARVKRSLTEREKKRFHPRFKYKNCPSCGKTCFSGQDRVYLAYHKKCYICKLIED